MYSNLDFSQEILILQHGVVTLKGQFLWSSNYTFLVEVAHEGIEPLQAVYKPTRGERPLWDFPEGTLGKREAAAFLVSQALGWHFVPPTSYREDAPLGEGSLQLFIDHDPERHYFNFSDEEKTQLAPVLVFDLLINNADRKGGHLFIDYHDYLWLIDHGICFHEEEKWRTVIWDFAGRPIPFELRKTVEVFGENLVSNPENEYYTQLQSLLSLEEINALKERAASLAHLKRFPQPPRNRPVFPYPPI